MYKNKISYEYAIKLDLLSFIVELSKNIFTFLDKFASQNTQILKIFYIFKDRIFLCSKELERLWAEPNADKKVKEIFLIYEKMQKYLAQYEAAVTHIWLCNHPFWISS